ncbi:MAG: hypothetical protein Q9201_005159 [Fulgogasparrea decipioides]
MDPSHCALLLHAGVCESWSGNAKYQEEAERILFDIAQEANARLVRGQKVVDVVEHVVSLLEDCPLFNAGKGAVLNEQGKHELEAGIADAATGAYGAVACVGRIKNPVKAAGLVMRTQRHCFLTGSAAEDLAKESGLDIVPNDHFTTATKHAYWEACAKQLAQPGMDLETVGALALDVFGNLAAAGSTGGLTNKMQGRIGDTAVMGAGIYVDKDIAVVCSGSGDDIFRHNLASKVHALHQTMPLADAVKRAVTDNCKTHPSACAILAIDRLGQSGIQSSGRCFLHAFSSAGGTQASSSGTTIPLLPQHTFYRNQSLSAGLTRYPTSTGHTVISCHATSALMSLQLSRFVQALAVTRRLSSVVSSTYGAARCGLVCDGSSVLSLIPLTGISKDWAPVVHEEEEFHMTYPGYLTSKNGPKMSDSELTTTKDKILSSTMLKEPYDYNFVGDPSDQNIFARLIRGELPQWRVWEDEKHVAFLTPFGNTPGYTVLIPRTHLSSDVFSLSHTDYIDIVTAAHEVGQHLMKAFGVARCGMFFEGYEIDYAHVKLVPVHENKTTAGQPFTPIPEPTAFQTKYEGYLTTQFGPLSTNLDELTKKAGSKGVCADLLLGPGKVLGLGQRHVDVQSVKEALKLHEVSEDHYRWYLDIRDEMKGGKPMLTTGWALTKRTRRVVYIFTDFQTINARGASVANEYLSAARARDSPFIPVILDCDGQENAQRMMSEERFQKLKQGKNILLHPALLAEMRGRGEIFKFSVDEEIEINISTIPTDQAAKVIAKHVSRIACWNDAKGAESRQDA